MTSFQTAVVDADGIPFVGVYKAESMQEGEERALAICDWLINDIFDRLGCKDYLMFFGTKTNIRKDVLEYKKNREKIKKTIPDYFQSVRQKLIEKYKGYMIHGIEADDACATMCMRIPNSVLVSNDKDLLQVNCYNYNYRSKKLIDCTKDSVIQMSNKKHVYTGKYMYFYQMLVGDTADNIKGVEGIGPVKAFKLITENPFDDLEDVIKTKYRECYGSSWEGIYNDTILLLKMRTDLQIPTPEFRNVPIKVVDEIDNLYT